MGVSAWALRWTKGVDETWRRVHGAHPPALRETVESLLRCGLADEEGPSGEIVLWGDGCVVLLSADRAKILEYRTLHDTPLPLRRGEKLRKPVNPLKIVRRLNDEGIDALVISNKLLNEMAHLAGEHLEELGGRVALSDVARDVIADAMDDLEHFLERPERDYIPYMVPEQALELTDSYAWLPSGEHRLRSDGWELVVSGDGYMLNAVRRAEPHSS